MTDDLAALWLPGRPVPWARTGGSGSRRFLRPEYRQWSGDAGIAARFQHSGSPIDDRVAVALRVFPNGISVGITALPERIRPVGIRGDLDNYAKSALDTLQRSGVLKDDRLVEALEVVFVHRPGGPK